MEDHPHACGDKTLRQAGYLQRTGSSPRVWGQEIRKDETNHLYRIIPTRVGTSDKNRTARHFCKDHPHACGDKSTLLRPCVLLQGSSPRVWGQVATENFIKYRVRIIPTRVGTSQKSDFKVSPIQDHPHACGDKGTYPRGLFYCLGSSPRVWGQVQLPFSSYVGLRIIPTRVGTRLKKSRKIAVLQNQPLRFPLTFHRSFV